MIRSAIHGMRISFHYLGHQALEDSSSFGYSMSFERQSCVSFKIDRIKLIANVMIIRKLWLLAIERKYEPTNSHLCHRVTTILSFAMPIAV